MALLPSPRSTQTVIDKVAIVFVFLVGAEILNL